MDIAGGLQRFRKTFGLKQREVADKIGIKQQAYQRYETGKTVPLISVLSKIADAYNVSVDYLIGRSDMPQPTNFDDREVREAFAAREELNRLRSIIVPAMSNQIGQVPAQ